MPKNAAKNTKSKKQVEEPVSEVDEAVEDLEEVVEEIEEMSAEEESPTPKGKGKAKPAAPTKGKAAAPAAKGGKGKAPAKEKAAAKGKGKPAAPTAKGKGAASPAKGGKGKAKEPEQTLAEKVTAALTKSTREGGYYNVETEKVHTKSVKALKDYVFYTLGDEGEIRIAGTAESETLTNALAELGYADAEPDAVEEKPKAPKAAKGKPSAKGTFTFTEAELRKLLDKFTKKITESLLADLKATATAATTECEGEEAPPKSKGKKVKEPEPVEEEAEVEEAKESEAEAEVEAEEEKPAKGKKPETASHYSVTLDKSLGVFVDKNQYVFESLRPDASIIGKVSGKKVIPLTAADVKAASKLSLRLWQVVKGKRDASKLMTQKEVDEQVKLAKEALAKPAKAEAKDTKVEAKGAKKVEEEAKTEEAEGSEAEVEPDAEGAEEGDDDGKTSEAEEQGGETEADAELEAKAEAIRAQSKAGGKGKENADPVETVQKVQSQVMDKPEELTKDEFKRIYAVKMAGKIPLTQTQKVADAAGVSLAKVKSAVINFTTLSTKKYPDVVAALQKPSNVPPKARLEEATPAKGVAAPPKKLAPKN